ncbi:GNAT family N-acetyltransferase [Geodermatophilus sp. CPCC 206100]|uniref:GNAT family N-acetyltransferase n=1 Tax=Geodermatophilus sp. CPCC 206100 TaxID=3020054 RepID=UPI003B00F416
MSGTGSRSRVATRTARPDDLPAVLSLVRQHRADAHAEGVLTGQTPGAAAAAGFGRLLADAGHRVVLAVRPGPGGDDGGAGEQVVGLAILGVDPLSVVLGVGQVTVDNLVVHRDHRRCGAGAALLAAAVAYAAETGAEHVVAAVGGHEAERQRFFARMGFAPLTTRRIVPRQTLARALTSWRRGGTTVPAPRRPPVRRRPVPLRGAGQG